MADDSPSWGDAGAAIGGTLFGPIGSVAGRWIGNSAYNSPGREGSPNFVGPLQSTGETSAVSSLPETTVKGSSGNDYTGLISSGINAVGGLIANKQSADSAAAAQSFSAEQYASRYQTTVRDLIAAGLSPMLAYQQGAGSAPSGVSYTAQNPFAGAASAYSSTRNLDVQREQTVTQTDLYDAQKNLTSSQRALADDNAKKIQKETANLDTQGEVLAATVRQLEEQTRLMRAQGLTQAEQTKVLVETVRKLHAEGTLANLDVKAQEAIGNLGKTAGAAKPIFDILKLVLSQH